MIIKKDVLKFCIKTKKLLRIQNDTKFQSSSNLINHTQQQTLKIFRVSNEPFPG